MENESQKIIHEPEARGPAISERGLIKVDEEYRSCCSNIKPLHLLNFRPHLRIKCRRNNQLGLLTIISLFMDAWSLQVEHRYKQLHLRDVQIIHAGMISE